MTHVGLVRNSNQDNFLVDEELGLIAVADGMGGHQGGEIASASALTSLLQFLQDSSFVQHGNDDLTIPVNLSSAMRNNVDHLDNGRLLAAAATAYNALQYANHRLYMNNKEQGHSGGDGMGTTLTGLWRHSETNQLLIFHVGDSRLYRYRDGELQLLTRDQTYRQQALEQGLTENLPRPNLLLQAIGPLPTIVPEIQHCDFLEGDVFLCCTDGLYADVPFVAISTIVGKARQGLSTACEELIELALEQGGKDNVSVLLLAC